MANQERLDFLTPSGARSAKRRHENERRRPGASRRNRRRLVHIDAAAEKELDDSYASPERSEVQESRGVRSRREDIGRVLQQRAELVGVTAARKTERLDRGLVAQARPMRSCAQRRRRLTLVDEGRRQEVDVIVNRASRVGYRRVERIAKVREPLFRQRARNRQQIVAMLERKMSAIAVATFAAEPLGEEALLRRTFIRCIAPERRPQRRVGVDPVVEPIDQRIDRRAAAAAHEDIAADEAAIRLGMSQKSTMLHVFLVVRQLQ